MMELEEARLGVQGVFGGTIDAGQVCDQKHLTGGCDPVESGAISVRGTASLLRRSWTPKGNHRKQSEVASSVDDEYPQNQLSKAFRLILLHWIYKLRDVS